MQTPPMQTPPMQIRELTPIDRPAAVDLWRRTGLTRPWNDPDGDFNRAVDGPTSTVLGAFGPALIGTAMVGEDGHRGWVYYLASAPEHRGQGIARALMDTAERWLRAAGAVKIQLMVRRTNAAAVGFYDRLGYEEQDVMVLGRRLD